jgi:hypothetical protein
MIDIILEEELNVITQSVQNSLRVLNGLINSIETRSDLK